MKLIELVVGVSAFLFGTFVLVPYVIEVSPWLALAGAVVFMLIAGYLSSLIHDREAEEDFRKRWP